MMEIDFNNLTEREKRAAERAVIALRNHDLRMEQSIKKLKETETVKELFSQGMKRTQIAETMGISYQRVQNMLGYYGSERNIKRVKRKVDAYLEEINGD